MTLFGIGMVHNEEDVIGTTIAHLIAEGVEKFLILDNGSTDRTREILGQFPQVTTIDDPEVGFFQSRKMSALAEDARCLGATWIIPFDADEIWYSPKGRLADVLNASVADVMWASTYEHPPQPPEQFSPYRTSKPKKLRKVAFRAIREVWIAQGNHNVSIAGPRVNGLEIREFQYRTFDQFVAKVRHGKIAYDATDMPEGEGVHWRTFGAMTDEQLSAEWKAMVTRGDVRYDPAPIRC